MKRRGFLDSVCRFSAGFDISEVGLKGFMGGRFTLKHFRPCGFINPYTKSQTPLSKAFKTSPKRRGFLDSV